MRCVWIGMVCVALLACGPSGRQAVEPIAVSDGSLRADQTHVDHGEGDADHAPAEHDGLVGEPNHTDAVSPDAPIGGGSVNPGGGLWVIDASGAAVGWLIQRGHPFQTQDGNPDILRDGVLVFAPADHVFFGVEMSSGKVLVPRLGISDSQCSKPVVAGYYSQGDQISGMAYAFAYKNKWWRVQAGKPTSLVQCAGVTKQGAVPTCVLHSGTCRGFPVEPLPSPTLPTSFKPPLHFSLTNAP